MLPLGSETKDVRDWRKLYYFFSFFHKNNIRALCPTTVRLWSDMSKFCLADVRWPTVICSPVMIIKINHNYSDPKARFKRRILHVLNLMQMRKSIVFAHLH